MSSNNIYGAFPTTTIGPFHYLYRITNLVENKHYYGIRTSKNILPQDDLGKKYFSSSSDKNFIQDQELHPEKYRYKIVITSNSREKVAELEVKLHRKFNVDVDSKFYNRMIQPSAGFDSTGMISVIDDEGNIFQTSVDDPRILTGELVHINKGKSVVKDDLGNNFRVSVDDYRIQTGEFHHISKGKTTVIDDEGNIFQTSVDDPRILTGELVHINKGKIYIHNIKTLKNKKIYKNEIIPDGWSVGFITTNTSKNAKRIFNSELKKNSLLKQGEELLPGWEFGTIDKLGEKITPPLLPKGSRRIYHSELKKNKYLKPGEEIPSGWQYGKKNFSGKTSIEKGSKRIFNQELKKNSILKPGEELLPGWEFGQRNKLGEKNNPPTQKGNRWIYNVELKQNIRIKQSEKLPNGWKFGFKKTWD